jgi:hypothetical protein
VGRHLHLGGEDGLVRAFATGSAFTQSLKVRRFVPDITAMSSLRLLSRWSTRSTLSAPSSLRIEVQPPSLRQAPSSAWLRLMFWLLAAAPREAAPPLNRLPRVRADFVDTLADLRGDEALDLIDRIDRSRSLRELWHLRTDVYHLVALHHSQSEAEQRLAVLNRHFPTRAPRSAFAPL